MKSRNFWTGLTAAAGMLVLILDSKTAIKGMREGIDLCLRTLIPSLFPFFALSILMTGSLLGRKIRLLRPVGSLCGIPDGTESLLLTGILGGYPVGAQNTALAYRQGTLSKDDAERMLGFCNNAGPAFLFGIVGQAFDFGWEVWALWAIHIISAILVGMIIRPRSRSGPVHPRQSSVTLTQALQKSLAVMAQVCGWVVLFRMILNYLDRWFLWLLPGEISVLVSGSLELSNGCVQLRSINCEGLRFIAASGMLAFGGLCVAVQTCSVANGLSLRFYFPGKLLQAAFSTGISLFAQLCLPDGQELVFSPALPAAVCAFSAILVLILQKKQNNSSIPVSVGV